MTAKRQLIGAEPDASGTAIEILLVEDNPGDARLVQEGLDVASVPTELHVAHDGEEALDRLYRRGSYEDAPRPELILLDLNLPGVDGHELLSRIKDDADLKEIPVVILTTSANEEDMRESYRLQAAGFITKPMDAQAFIAAIQELGLYWVSVVELPSA